ncbi:MAG TPA: hypothetical protein VFJ58_24760 [Armatimonadota bacterium]|nr:hypothetical protein [Armatimonadota bacterium]
MPLTFALLAGEASGDAQGALLVEAIRSLQPDARFLGIGGPRMQSAGVEIIHNSGEWGSIGIIESLRLYFPLNRIKDELVRRFGADPPDLLIPIDFGYFNVRVAHPLHRRGVRVLYYFPPRSWSQAAHVSPRLKESVDLVATPFPWSADRFRAAGVPVSFVGHPLLDAAARTPDRRVLCSEWGLDPDRPIVALLPGSRGHEIKYLWPQLLIAASRILRKIPNAQFVTPIAPTVDRRRLEASTEKILRRLRNKEHERALIQREMSARHNLNLRVTQYEEHPERRVIPVWQEEPDVSDDPDDIKIPIDNITLRLVDGRTADALAAADAAAICSGTATLEAAILQSPMVILYGGSWLMAAEWALRKSHLAIPFIGMPNLLAGRLIVPEMIQEDASGPKIAREIISLLTDSARAEKMKADLAAATACLGEPGATARAAALAVAAARGDWSDGAIAQPEGAHARAAAPTAAAKGDK